MVAPLSNHGTEGPEASEKRRPDDGQGVEVGDQPAANTAIDMDEIAAREALVTARVPRIGTRWRWYDIPYRLCQWLLRGWPGRFLGWRVRTVVNGWLNFFIPFNEHQRNRAQPPDDSMHNLLVPESEVVQQAGVWVMEIFPPSRYGQLMRSLRRTGWDRADVLSAPKSNLMMVNAARTRGGPSWWTLGAVAAPHSYDSSFGAVRQVLPAEFSRVEVTAVQIGLGLTAVVGFFRFSDLGQGKLDSVWRGDHQPTLRLHGLRRPSTKSRHFAGIEATQEERQRLADLARDWLGERLPGYFYDQPRRQPVMDLMLFGKFDPLEDDLDPEFHSALQALGLGEVQIWTTTSPQMAGLCLIETNEMRPGESRLRNCWGAVGKLGRVNELSTHEGYGEKPYSPSTLAHMFDRYVRRFLLYVGVMEYLADLRASQAKARDLAASRHGRHRVRQLRNLRQELLVNGLDLPMVERDTGALWSERWRAWERIDVFQKWHFRSAGTTPDEQAETDLILSFGERREHTFKDLMGESRAYREAMATAASLGSSIEASRLARVALWVAAGSLLVALVTLLLVNTDGPSLWSELVKLVGPR